MTAHLGFSNQKPTRSPVAPPPPVPPAVPTNTAAHAAPGARPIVAASQLLKDCAKKFETHLSTINPAGLDETRLHSEVSAFAESPAMNQITDAVDIATRRQEDADAHVAEVIRKLQPEGDTAQELRNSRVWDRAARQLDSVPTSQVAEVARRLIADSTDTELGVLVAELPALLASKNHSSDWVNQVLAERVPELAEAKKAAQLAAQSRQILTHDAELLRSRITNTVAPRAYTPIAFIDTSDYDPDR